MINTEEHKTLKIGSLLISNKGNYKIESVLGMGGFGITYKATKDVYEGNIAHRHTYAIKEFFCPDMCWREEGGEVAVNPAQQSNYDTCHKAFQDEARLLSKLPNHDGFVSVNELFDANNTSYYVMQYLEYSLTQKVQENNDHKLSEKEARDVFCKVADAVAILHENRRLHLDIKPDNIMFSGGTPCLIDFGNSRAYNKKGNIISQETKIICSDGYAPQEQYSGVETFSPQTDIYSLGATLFYMLTGETPLPSNEISDAYIDEKLQNVQDARIKKAIKTSLAANRNSRYESVQQLLTSLNYVSYGGTETKIILDKTERKGETIFGKIVNCVKQYYKYVIYCFTAITAFYLLFLTGGNFVSRCNSSTHSGDTIPDTTKVVADTITNKQDNVTTQHEDTTNNISNEEVDNQQESTTTESYSHSTEYVSNSLDLGWGIWHGKVENEDPKGIGWIEVHNEKNIRGVTVSPGDKIKECEMDGKRVYIGTVYHLDGTIEEILP